MRPKRSISAVVNYPIVITFKDVWKNQIEKGVYKIYVHDDGLEFNLISMVKKFVKYSLKHLSFGICHVTNTFLLKDQKWIYFVELFKSVSSKPLKVDYG